MSTKFPLPKDDDLKNMLKMLFGDELVVESKECDLGDKAMYALYLDDEDAPVCASIFDHNFAAFAGSSLTRIPVGGAEDAAASGDFSEMMLSNVNEVMNICSRALMDNSSPHLRLDKIYATLDAMPDNARGLIETNAGRAGFSVNIPEYGTGDVAFVSC